MNVFNLNDVEVDFSIIPITILSISDFEQDLDDINESGLDDGIYYAIQLYDKNVEKDIKAQLISILHQCINVEKRLPAGYNIPYINVEESLKPFFIYSPAEESLLLSKGINPLVLKNNTIYVWGQFFILNGKPLQMVTRVTGNSPMNCTSTLVEYAMSINALKIKENNLDTTYEELKPFPELEVTPLSPKLIETMCYASIRASLAKDSSLESASRLEQAICGKVVAYVIANPLCSIKDMHKYCIDDKIDVSVFYRSTRKPIWVLEDEVHINILKIFRSLTTTFS